MKTITTVILVLLLTGCASMTRGTWDVLNLETVPAGAECNLSNGMVCASTPCALRMKRKSEGQAVCKKEGYQDGIGNWTNKTAGAGAAGMAGNVLLGGIIGAGIDAGSGATKDLTPNPLVITLEPEEEQ